MREQGAEENVWFYEWRSNREMEDVASWGTSKFLPLKVYYCDSIKKHEMVITSRVDGEVWNIQKIFGLKTWTDEINLDSLFAREGSIKRYISQILCKGVNWTRPYEDRFQWRVLWTWWWNLSFTKEGKLSNIWTIISCSRIPITMQAVV